MDKTEIKELKNKIKELQEMLEIAKDEIEKGNIQSQIKVLEKELPSPIWKKLLKGLVIAGLTASLVSTVMGIVLVFL